MAEFSRIVLNKNGEVSPVTPSPLSPLERINRMPFVRFDPATGLVTQTNQQINDAASAGLLAPLTALFTEHSVDLAVGLVGGLMIAAAVFQIAKPL